MNESRLFFRWTEDFQREVHKPRAETTPAKYGAVGDGRPSATISMGDVMQSLNLDVKIEQSILTLGTTVRPSDTVFTVRRRQNYHPPTSATPPKVSPDRSRKSPRGKRPKSWRRERAFRQKGVTPQSSTEVFEQIYEAEIAEAKWKMQFQALLNDGAC